MRRRRKKEWARSYTLYIHLKHPAEALKITAELTVQEWNDFGLAVTRMDDVHVNRQEGEGGGEGDGEGERGGVYIDNQQKRETV